MATSNPPPDGRHILIVDDNATIRRYTSRMLEDAGLATALASDAAGALEHLSRGLPRLVLMDLGLPDMGGRELMGHIADRYGDAAPPTVVITGEDLEQVPGAVAVLIKPFSATDLVSTVQRHARG